MSLTVIHKVKNPKFLVITPLRLGDEIYPILMETIWNNKIDFDWVSYCGPHNIPMNTQKGLLEYCKHYRKPKYFIKVDNDISFSKCPALDEMYKSIKDSSKKIAYVYSSFSYIGRMLNRRFLAEKFNPKQLLDFNTISSVSMIKTSVFEKTGGYITDDKYVRLLDWAHWLHLLRWGYEGLPCPSAYFEAIVDKAGISNAPADDYHKKRVLVIKDFVEPLKEKYK